MAEIKTVLTDQQIEDAQGRAFQELSAKGYNGGMGGRQWDRASARAIEAAVLEASANAEWLTTAHIICTDAGIAQGHINNRLNALRDVLSANAGKVDIKDGEIEQLRQMVNDLRDDACDCDACSAARDYMASVESTTQQASDAGRQG